VNLGIKQMGLSEKDISLTLTLTHTHTHTHTHTLTHTNVLGNNTKALHLMQKRQSAILPSAMLAILKPKGLFLCC